MAESTLSLKLTDIQKSIANMLGMTSDYSVPADATDLSRLNEAIDAGLRQFYFPPPLPGEAMIHEWTFLRPLATLVTWNSITGTISSVGGTGNKTITATTSVFLPSLPGNTFVADTSGTEYRIVSYVSGTQITVASDASADDGDTFTISASGDYRLPDDFGGIEGDLTFAQDESRDIIRLRGDGFIRQLRMSSTGSSIPRYAAVKSGDNEAIDGSDGQRFDLMLHPTPDGTYNITYRYNVHPDALTSNNPYPLGGATHAETIIQSCRAAADRIVNDIADGREYALFLERLKASVYADRQKMTPEFLGRNIDRSDLRELARPRHPDDLIPSVTVNGVVVQ